MERIKGKKTQNATPQQNGARQTDQVLKALLYVDVIFQRYFCF